MFENDNSVPTLLSREGVHWYFFLLRCCGNRHVSYELDCLRFLGCRDYMMWQFNLFLGSLIAFIYRV